ncbi:NADH dehydrogenase [ubiquinone] 1 beta subcomplex subunit 5, mitochondrial [Halotydeus destructor]|nr:NADH dehydrogenase [ubiquinone] 1 beta subcomplex subunit 5, mitochondrial [Halotydeus destructor]
MAVLSVCRNFGQLNKVGWMLINQTRSGHGNNMPITPSTFQFKKFKDLLHFYTMLGFIPCFLLASYYNLTQGPGILTETPEGYCPQYEEYQKHPITRLIVKMKTVPQHNYEMRLSCLNSDGEAVIMRRIEDQVKNVMKARGDYKAWFNVYMDAKDYRRMREVWTHWENRIGSKEPVWMRDEEGEGGYQDYKNPYGEGKGKRS